MKEPLKDLSTTFHYKSPVTILVGKPWKTVTLLERASTPGSTGTEFPKPSAIDILASCMLIGKKR